jgi:hypothetical protein
MADQEIVVNNASPADLIKAQQAFSYLSQSAIGSQLLAALVAEAACDECVGFYYSAGSKSPGAMYPNGYGPQYDGCVNPLPRPTSYVPGYLAGGGAPPIGGH